MSMIFRRYWIISGRAAIRQVTYSCVSCVRHRAACPQLFMANLPAMRVQQHRPFSFVGMDYGGPFTVKEGRRKNLILFICLFVKAVHLELVSNLPTEAFLAAFKRFIARRGKPVEIRSDCGTNYVARQIKARLWEGAVQETLHARISCQWKFNPPAAPHFGGIWEAAIKCTKMHLKKFISAQVLTTDVMSTLIIRIERVLNLRRI